MVIARLKDFILMDFTIELRECSDCWLFLFTISFDSLKRILMDILNTKWLPVLMVVIYGCAAGTGVIPTETSSAEETVVQESAPLISEEAVEPESNVPSSLYTAAQSERGEDSFRDTCLSCHSSSEFRGRSFQRDWRGSSMGYLYEEIVYYMPEDNPGGLATSTYLDIMAYILDQNGFPAGETELVSDIDAMKEIVLFPRDQ